MSKVTLNIEYLLLLVVVYNLSNHVFKLMFGLWSLSLSNRIIIFSLFYLLSGAHPQYLDIVRSNIWTLEFVFVVKY
jgi:hypothetical protein